MNNTGHLFYSEMLYSYKILTVSYNRLFFVAIVYNPRLMMGI